jgi:hypothetical protein
MMSKPTPLVTQHLEKIDRHALEEYQDIVRRYVRGRQGVYALYRDNKLYYVGLAGNLRNRLKQHLKDRHSESWNRFSVYLTIGDSHLKELESLILRIVTPSGNKQRGKLMKSEDLREKFRRAIRELHRKREDKIIGGIPGDIDPIRENLPQDKSGRVPVLSVYTNRPKILRAKFKRITIWAHIRKDGSIRCNGEVYLSPSLAAAAACKRKTCNGWTFWSYERSPGDWVKIDELRK